MPPIIHIREDDLSGAATQALLELHLASMHGASPPGSVFALDLSGLKTPTVTVWSAWRGTSVAGIAALKRLGDGTGEIKSMRTHPDHLRQGVAAALLDHIIAHARARLMKPTIRAPRSATTTYCPSSRAVQSSPARGAGTQAARCRSS